MDEAPPLPRDFLASLDRSEADLAAGRTTEAVPFLELVRDRALARIKAKQARAETSAPT